MFLILILFFTCWIDVVDMPVKIHGYLLPFDLSQLDEVKQYLSVSDLSFLKISYLVYFLPLSAIGYIIGVLSHTKRKIFYLNFGVALIVWVVTHEITLYLFPDASDFFTWSFKLLLPISILGIIFQLITYIKAKKVDDR